MRKLLGKLVALSTFAATLASASTPPATDPDTAEQARRPPGHAYVSAHAQTQVIEPATLPFEAGRLGVPSATIGSPDRAGLYMFFVHYAQGMRSPLHIHRDDRMLTVLRGTLYLVEGPDRLDTSSVQPIQAGSSVLIRAGTPHFGWAKDGDVLTQEIGAGPTSTTVVREAK